MSQVNKAGVPKPLGQQPIPQSQKADPTKANEAKVAPKDPEDPARIKPYEQTEGVNPLAGGNFA
jgi:hypothetical protein